MVRNTFSNVQRKGKHGFMYDNIYTTEETAKILKIGTSTFRRLIEAGEAPTHTIVGKRKRFTHSRIMEWIEENEVVNYNQ